MNLDRRLAVSGRSPAPKLSPGTNSSLYQWAAAAPGTLTAFGAVAPEHSPTQYGFYSVDAAGMHLLLAADEREKEFFLLGSPFIAAIDNETFFVSMAKHPALYRVREGKAEKLNALPRKYALRPDFTTTMTGPSNAPARFAELETFSVPAGLYAQNGYLYLLTREPAGGGKTTWWLYKIDPSGTGSVAARMRLPTTSNYLTVIPTPERGWMLVERGVVGFDPAQKHQTQKVGPVVVVSNAAIQSLASPKSCPLGGGILWADETHSRALFIPERLLASKLLLPVDLSTRQHLDLRLAEERQSTSPCDFLEPSMGQGTLPEASPLGDLVAASQIALVGKVVGTEPGWDARERHVVTKVNLKVEHPLKGTLKQGSTIDFLSPGGGMHLAGKSICTSPRSGFYQPRKGDWIVVSAEPSTGNSRLLEAPYVFPLIRGKVQPEPYPALSAEQKPLSLSKLRDSSSNDTF